jgi:hypothetical protein
MGDREWDANKYRKNTGIRFPRVRAKIPLSYSLGDQKIPERAVLITWG